MSKKTNNLNKKIRRLENIQMKLLREKAAAVAETKRMRGEYDSLAHEVRNFQQFVRVELRTDDLRTPTAYKFEATIDGYCWNQASTTIRRAILNSVLAELSFGISKACHTRFGELVLTGLPQDFPEYRSPEQIQRERKSFELRMFSGNPVTDRSPARDYRG